MGPMQHAKIFAKHIYFQVKFIFGGLCLRPLQKRPTVSALNPLLHQIHVAGYKYPGRATFIRIQVDTTCIQATCIRCKRG